MTGGVWQVMKEAQPETVLMDTSIPVVRAGPPSPIFGVSLSLHDAALQVPEHGAGVEGDISSSDEEDEGEPARP